MSAIETMPTGWLWVHLIALAVITYVLRGSFIGVFSYYDMPDGVKDQLALMPPAVLSALAVPPLVFRDGTYHLSPANPFLVAGFVGAVVAWRTESLIWTMVVGFITYFVVISVPGF